MLAVRVLIELFEAAGRSCVHAAGGFTRSSSSLLLVPVPWTVPLHGMLETVVDGQQARKIAGYHRSWQRDRLM